MEEIAASFGSSHSADFIAGLYRTEDEELDGIFHMKILKSRLGQNDNLKFQFDKHTMEFKDINHVVDSDKSKELVVNSTNSNLIKKPLGLPKCQIDDIENQLLFQNDLGMP